jgi:hypothetical protein
VRQKRGSDWDIERDPKKIKKKKKRKEKQRKERKKEEGKSIKCPQTIAICKMAL